ncbi:MAG: 6-bladed beta-propeller [Bacteroidales bacterium]
MKKVIIVLIIGITILSSCKNSGSSQDKSINIKSVSLPYRIDIEKNIDNIKPVLISSIGRALEYIPLETSPNCLLKRITQIDFSDSYIFVCDFYKLLQFDREGKFIRQIGAIGRGPGEYIYVSGYCIDEKKNKVYIIAWGINSVLEFDFNGVFIRSFNISFPSFQLLKTDTNSFSFVIINSSETNDSENRIIITDSMGVPQIKIKNHNRFYSKPGLMATKIPMYYFKDTIRILESRVDTLNTFENAKHKPYAIFSFGQVKMEPDIKIPFQNPERDEVTNRIKEKLWIWTISENDKYIFLKFNLGISDSSKFCIFNKQSEETTFLEQHGFKNDLDGGITFWPKYVYNDTVLVDYEDAFNILKRINKKQPIGLKEPNNKISDKFEKLGKGLTETSNPVLIVLK